MLSSASLLVPLAAAGWTEAGPERGHVLDAALGQSSLSVASRAGVLTATYPPEGSLEGSPEGGALSWRRDPRFPGDTRRLAYAEGRDDLAWAAVPGGLWRLDRAGLAPVWEDPSSSVVDLVTIGDVAYAAVRGAASGLLRVDAEGATRVRELDPWCVAASGGQLLVGATDGQALAGAPDALSLLIDLGAPISACAWVDGAPWVASAEGALSAGGELLLTFDDGVVVGIAEIEGGALVAVAGRAGGDNRLLQVSPDGRAAPAPGALDEDPGKVDWTGLLALPRGEVLVGTFRRGPALFDGALHPARGGFRATMLGGVDLDDQGRLLLALMGTGVYALEPDGAWRGLHGSTTAVTDSVGVVAVREGLAVLDFSGVGLWGLDGAWRRIAGVDGPPGQSQLVDLVEGPEGWWAIDGAGRLLERDGEEWRVCAGERGLHLDGRGADARLFTAKGVRRPGGCEEGWPADPDAPPGASHAARADGGWFAAPGGLWRDGTRVVALPEVPVTALRAGPDAVLVGLKDGQLLRCAETCERLTRFAGELGGVGWLPDGRVWAVEAAGTLFIEGGDAEPSPWPRRYLGRLRGGVMALERPPWSADGAGVPAGRQGAGAPEGGPHGAAGGPRGAAVDAARRGPSRQEGPSAPVATPRPLLGFAGLLSLLLGALIALGSARRR